MDLFKNKSFKVIKLSTLRSSENFSWWPGTLSFIFLPMSYITFGNTKLLAACILFVCFALCITLNLKTHITVSSHSPVYMSHWGHLIFHTITICGSVTSGLVLILMIQHYNANTKSRECSGIFTSLPSLWAHYMIHMVTPAAHVKGNWGMIYNSHRDRYAHFKC